MFVFARKKRGLCICVCMVGGESLKHYYHKIYIYILIVLSTFFSPKTSYTKIQQSQSLGYVFSILAWSNIWGTEFPEPLLKAPLAGTVRAFSFKFIRLGQKGNSGLHQLRISEQNLIATDTKTVPHYKPCPTIKSLTRTKVDSD